MLGSPALRRRASTLAAAGLAYGLLQADKADEFRCTIRGIGPRVHARHAHGARASDVTDRDTPATAYTAGEVTAPTYLKWMLCFEEPETRTLAREGDAARLAAVARRRSSLQPHDAVRAGELHDHGAAATEGGSTRCRRRSRRRRPTVASASGFGSRRGG